MMDHPIALAIPSKIERFGVCYHGLFLAPLSQDGRYKFSDIEIITRSGRRIKPIEPKLKDGSDWREYYPVELSRPALYMHPMAVSSVEEDTGIDFSGYVITYDARRNDMPTYLNHIPARWAYTPDSDGQGVVFSTEATYMSPIRIGKSINTGGYVSLPTQRPIEKVLSVTPDGRTRVRGSFPDLADIFYMWYWFASGQTDRYKPFIESYSLSGESGSIVATPVAVAQPEYSYDTDSQLNVGERVVRYRLTLPYVGQCTDPSVWDTTGEIVRERNPDVPDYSRSYEKMTSDIDVCADALSPTFLSCSVEIERVVTNSDDADGGGSISWGDEECSQYIDSYRECLGTSSFVNTSRTSTLLESESISLTGWGGSSSAGAVYTSSLKSEFNASTVDGIEVSRTETNDFESSIIVTLEGQTMMSKQNWPTVTQVSGLSYDLPRALQGAETHIYLNFLHTDHEKGLIEAGVNFARAAFYKMSLSADGVHALACCVTEGVVAFSPGVGFFLDPATVTQRLVIGRIFGFGISVPGRELTEAEMNSQLFIAYDPLEKKFSDIYTHPVFYQ